MADHICSSFSQECQETQAFVTSTRAEIEGAFAELSQRLVQTASGQFCIPMQPLLNQSCKLVFRCENPGWPDLCAESTGSTAPKKSTARRANFRALIERCCCELAG